MRIIAFNGIARGGKTTCAEFMEKWCNLHGMKPIRCSFADPMKRAAARIGLSKDRNPTLYRKTLQSWGERKRDPDYQPGRSGPNYWVDRVRRMIVEYAAMERKRYDEMNRYGLSEEFKETVLIFDDLRYPNELELVYELDGIAVFVDGAPVVKDITAEWRLHESEALAMAITFGVIDSELFDYYVPNSSDLTKLEELVYKLAPAWLDHDYLCPNCGGDD